MPKVSVLSAADETAGVEERRGIDETPEMVWGSHQDTQDRGFLNGIGAVPNTAIAHQMPKGGQRRGQFRRTISGPAQLTRGIAARSQQP